MKAKAKKKNVLQFKMLYLISNKIPLVNIVQPHPVQQCVK